MPTRKVREITIYETKGTFSILKSPSENYDFSGISALRQVLSNEKSRILHAIKIEKPTSVYDLAKRLGRSFKSVSDDIKVLQRFGFIELIQEKTKNRIRHRPVIAVDTVTVHFKV